MIYFSDKSVTYSTFVNDVAAAIVKMLSDIRSDSEVISQRQAYALFGRGNVDRWRRQGKIVPFSKRPGKIEYRTSELRLLQQVKQDYFQL